MNKVTLTKTDYDAIIKNNSGYILNKGANKYDPETYDEAVEYYHLAAAMGEAQAAANLGYCYLYGRSIEQNTSLAIGYFQIAAARGNVDALYKLGNIYSNDKFVEQDTELSLYYYELALEAIDDFFDVGMRYPSLYLSMAKEFMPDGALGTNLEKAYDYLETAREGYEIAIDDGAEHYKNALAETIKLLESDTFAKIREAQDSYEY